MLYTLGFKTVACTTIQLNCYKKIKIVVLCQIHKMSLYNYKQLLD